VIRGTRGVPGTVAPFRAWRGSRDLVAQSPKFHAPALAQIFRERKENTSTAFLTQPKCAPSPNKPVRSKNFFCFADPHNRRMDYDFGFAAAGASGGSTSDGLTQFTLNGPAP
jgi:hypothetical protein